ncbi:hypothetical protein ACTMU2_15790 [Cupriavidus basilensis]
MARTCRRPWTRRFNGDQRDVARVLTERVLAHIGADRFQFLMEIALVHEFSAGLAQFMTGYDEARSLARRSCAA